MTGFPNWDAVAGFPSASLLLSTTRTLPSRAPALAIIAGVSAFAGLNAVAAIFRVSAFGRDRAPQASAPSAKPSITVSGRVPPSTPAFPAPSHRDQHHSRPRYRDDALTGTACAPKPRPQMLAGIADLAPSHLPTSLPRSRVPGPHPRLVPHARARPPPVEKGKRGERDVTHTILPVHVLVLAAHCAKLPRLPPWAPAGSSRAASATLPVLPLTLPSPHAFAILHAFMYTHRLTPAFLTSARSWGMQELWQDMVALGVYDPELWDALDLAWEGILGALNLAAQ
ncbi:hypothetical protein DFH09DRAFT_1314926 [Mycena vulgaris]|nr:hypothetical protein DFH09DRAFT_1314926 [Mycena vulgaris]